MYSSITAVDRIHTVIDTLGQDAKTKTNYYKTKKIRAGKNKTRYLRRDAPRASGKDHSGDTQKHSTSQAGVDILILVRWASWAANRVARHYHATTPLSITQNTTPKKEKEKETEKEKLA